MSRRDPRGRVSGSLGLGQRQGGRQGMKGGKACRGKDVHRDGREERGCGGERLAGGSRLKLLC